MPIGSNVRAKYAREKTIFFRHEGAVNRDVYLRVNPQALRIQQGNKGSVVDTLGGYFREVMFSADPQHNGLLLPDLTIECETGAGYREELQRLEWIWRHHADPKPDGSPADTYLMDFADGSMSVGGANAVLGGGKILTDAERGGPYKAAMGNDRGIPRATVAQAQKEAYSLISSLPRQSGVVSGDSKIQFSPRCFKIEILNFSWDESVQDPFRVRFNFRCKVLRDEFWTIEGNDLTGQPMYSLGDSSGLADAAMAAMGGAAPSAPLNVAAQTANIQATNTQFGLPESITSQVGPLLQRVQGMAGLGQNRVAQKALGLGQSAFGLNQPTSPRGTPQDLNRINAILTDLILNLPEIAGVRVATTVQVGDWAIPIPELPSPLAQLNLASLSTFGPTVAAANGDRSESASWR